MGGGVGKAVAALILQAAKKNPGDEHRVLCLERPVKSQFVVLAESAGCQFMYGFNADKLVDEVDNADIVQLEFWNHPAIIKFLWLLTEREMRLLVWCHISGINFPLIPVELIKKSQCFLLTSECSYESPELLQLPPDVKEKLRVVSSGNIGDLPYAPIKKKSSTLKSGYLGTLNFSKLHPHYASIVSAVEESSFRIKIFGDMVNREVLQGQCNLLNRPRLLDFQGYTNDVPGDLSRLDLFVYILNPYHYGTAENALLEAMAMGVVPIVLGNACEMTIVDHGRTGVVVNNPQEFAASYHQLSGSPDKIRELSLSAIDYVRSCYTSESMESRFASVYDELMEQPKDGVNFSDVFGHDPITAMSQFYRDFSIFHNQLAYDKTDELSRYGFFERTKGSIFHFLDYFPDDPQLHQVAGFLNRNKNLSSDPCSGQYVDGGFHWC